MAKRVHTEADVRRMEPGSILELGPHAVATPSALDEARSRGIRVRRVDRPGAASDGGCEPCSRSEAGALGRALEAAGDGSFHLERRDGRVRLWRLGPEGPVELPFDR